jgi:hypothetical protein
VVATPACKLLSEALAGPVQVLATLRPEFLDPLLANPELAALPTRTQTVRPLRPEALRAVIEGPADRAGIGVDAELVARLVANTSAPPKESPTRWARWIRRALRNAARQSA